MRKLLALLLSVLMLASLLAAIPAFAAAGTYDGTTKDTVNKILITEIGRKMYYHTGDKVEHVNALNFVEIYNNGEDDVNLTDLSLLLGVEFNDKQESGPYADARVQNKPLYLEWSNEHRFLSKMDIKAGALLDDAVTAQKYIDLAPSDGLTEQVYNEFLTNAAEDMTLSNGETAVIWLVTPQTIEWIADESGRPNFNPKKAFLESAGIAPGSDGYNKYTVVMVWAYSDYEYTDAEGTFRQSSALAEDMFNFENVPTPETVDRNYVLGVAKSTWDVGEDRAYTESAGNKTINEDLYCISVLGRLDRVEQRYAAENDFTVTYAPAAATPHVQNARKKLIGDTTTTYTDYFDAGIVKSYREMGVIDWKSKPTPGMMPDWQWAIVDPTNDKAPAAVKAEGGAAEAIRKYIEEDLRLVNDGSNAGRDESDIGRDYNFESQKDLAERFNNTKKKEEVEDSGMPTWALILIIVGGVLVVAGGACAVVFLVILPKKRAAAMVAGDASAEEALAEDAPVEEAPAEETPAAEENKEE